MVICVPAALNNLAHLYVALRKMRIQVMQVDLSTSGGLATYLLDVAEFDGSNVSRRRWAALQATVLTCILEASLAELSGAKPRLGTWAAFRDMLQKATHPQAALARRQV
jgi:hypothetical protein